MSPPTRFEPNAPYSKPHPNRRILHVAFCSRLGGSERYCADLANRQAAAGHEVHVAGMRNSYLRHALAPAVQFHGLGRLFRSYQLRRLTRRLEPEICHGHLGAACKALGRIRGKHQSLATLHVGYKSHHHARLDGLICVNHAQASRLTDYSGKARTIANWMPAVPEITPPGIREELGLSPEIFLVGAVGRLHESKGADVLISAFRAVAPSHAALVILGEGPQREQLEKLRANDPRIHLLGFRSVVHGCLRDLDLFVSPSREESFGLAIVEAMSAGLPIIATAAEGPAEYLRDQPAVLVPPGSLDDMIGALSAMHTRFRAGRLSRVTYDLTLFDPVERIANIMDFYTHVIDMNQARRSARATREVFAAT